MPEQCAYCRFYTGSDCHRHAPVKEMFIPTAQWPKVRQSDFCGDWASQPEDEEPPDDE